MFVLTFTLGMVDKFLEATLQLGSIARCTSNFHVII